MLHNFLLSNFISSEATLQVCLSSCSSVCNGKVSLAITLPCFTLSIYFFLSLSIFTFLSLSLKFSYLFIFFTFFLNYFVSFRDVQAFYFKSGKMRGFKCLKVVIYCILKILRLVKWGVLWFRGGWLHLNNPLTSLLGRLC